MIAFLAPGQGMERVGMGLDVAAAWPEVAEMMEIAREAAGLEHTCGHKPDGLVACWGRNFEGQLDWPLPDTL